MRTSLVLASWMFVLAAVLACAGCDEAPGAPSPDSDAPPADASCPAPEACGAAVSIAPAGRALVVRDPEVLRQFALSDVLARILALHGDDEAPPEVLARRFFDVDNTSAEGVFADGMHCDSPGNPAHIHAPAAFCPRAEGRLALGGDGAAANGLLDPASEDFFYPVAIVNRFDLAVPFATCGQFRIVYAKKSGLRSAGDTDEQRAWDDRAFLVLEAAIPAPNRCASACFPVASFWEGLQREEDPDRVAALVRSFFFEGLPGFAAPLDPASLGLGNAPDTGGYYGTSGQIRVSEHMDRDWQFREMRLAEIPKGGDGAAGPLLGVMPVTVKSNPTPFAFERPEFEHAFAGAAFALARARSLDEFSVFGPSDAGTFWNSGESALGGPALNDYAAHAAPALRALVADSLDYLHADCPPGDPVTVDSVLLRATSQSCAGCHAPSQLLGHDRKLGCGMVWPESLGQVHIDEQGNLSPALREVFLPHRAHVLERFLEACDILTVQDTTPSASASN